MARARTPFNECFTIQSNTCWLWNAANPSGYGQYDGESAHRYAYRTMVAPIPDGLEIDHLCCNKACVNPHHLQPVTHQMNQSRAYWARGYSVTPGGGDGGIRAQKQVQRLIDAFQRSPESFPPHLQALIEEWIQEEAQTTKGA